MNMVIPLDCTTLELLRRRAALLAKIQHEKTSSGDPHPCRQNFNELTTTIQMRLGRLAFEQAIALVTHGEDINLG